MGNLNPKRLMALLIAAAVGRGSEWFVDSVNGSANYNGQSWYSAKASIATALALASAGDKIYVSEVHAESIVAAAGIDITKAGIRLIGTGQGDRKPTITLSTATTATFKITADNVTIRNFRFVCDIDSLVKFLNVSGNHITIEDCDFVTSSTKEALSFINIATTYDFITIRRCRFIQPTDPAGSDGGADTGGVYFVDTEHITIEDCDFYGNFETACIHNRTTACKNLRVIRCTGIQALSGAEPFQLVAGATGYAKDCGFITPAETATTEATLAGTVGDGFFFLNTQFGNDGGAGGQGGIAPTAAS